MTFFRSTLDGLVGSIGGTALFYTNNIRNVYPYIYTMPCTYAEKLINMLHDHPLITGRDVAFRCH